MRPRQVHASQYLTLSSGSLSFVPVFLFTVYLYIVVRAFFLPNLSRIPRKIVSYVLLAFVPFAIAMEELSSFVGISYRTFIRTVIASNLEMLMRFLGAEQNNAGSSFLEIGFDNSDDRTVWQFFTSTTLAFLIVVEVSLFMLAVFSAILMVRGRRLPEDSPSPPTVRGIAWISAGMMLGAIETLLGFTNGGFQVVLARRFLRMFSRFFLTMGTLLWCVAHSFGYIADAHWCSTM